MVDRQPRAGGDQLPHGTADVGGDLRAPADPVQQHIQPGQRVVHPEPLLDQLADPGQRPALVLPAPRGRAGIQHRLQLAQLGRGQLAPAPPAPMETRAARPSAASARRHRFADIRHTRNRFATSRSLAPASISSAAASRTRSRRVRSAAVSPRHLWEEEYGASFFARSVQLQCLQAITANTAGIGVPAWLATIHRPLPASVSFLSLQLIILCSNCTRTRTDLRCRRSRWG
jgi:hypothetical protein